ncbi:uncharacterized protein LACBIDRAFT_327363 [Laccaria bicolor S238N-H82]|uniref:Protein kinase domain-containing protein n=1 Tax=Laccaria bicolor (strain S238N-H82 / ATCC MYA-4686) TaxID=486041 RepID=B0DAU5_LACBS|nr:uncharacterized protein LACBIDRAFT_327363 [Laccaria bicolor S238N-H82]EDR08270.1 hypothetical protein LACBIDRAFT_327363 [Laccaria bicolor S238N-H82]|eukprot:XP_001881340.1 hypothetical protein LACBIDRAFT_327363 [Laccaria bicolor S238N-H82]
MPKPSSPNSPSRQNPNRPSSPLKGAHPILRSVSGPTSKAATPGKQRRTVSSSAANGKEGFAPVKLPTIQSDHQELPNATPFPSLPDPALSLQNSTPRKADKSRAVLPPSPETTPKAHRRLPRGHNTLAPTPPKSSPRGQKTATPTAVPVLDPFIVSREKTSSEMEKAEASNRSAQPKSLPKNLGTADSPIDVDKILSTKLRPSPQIPVPKGKQRRKASSPAAIENIVFSKNPTSPKNPPAAQSDLAERQKPVPLPPVSDPAQSLRESKPRKSEKLARALYIPRSVGENGKSANEHGPATHASEHSSPVLASPVPVADDESTRSFLSSVPDFFAWSPTSGVEEKTISGSGSTRAPARWDRHLHDKFILKKVVSAPELTALLGEIADSALERAQKANPNHCKPNQLPEKTTNLGAACIKNTEYESEVRDFYKESIAPPCLEAAGVLGFGAAGDFLKWQSKLYGQREAKADGFLVVTNLGSDFLALPDKFKTRIKLLEDWNLNVLAIWEFKSLAAGSKETMEAIIELSLQESFSWTGCTSHDRCNSIDSIDYHPSGPLPVNTGKRTSPDSLECLIESQPKVPKRSPDVEDENSDETLSYIEGIYPGDETPEYESRLPHAKEPQAWAEAVQNDATFIVINAGLYEVIGLRHRASQTLYLSDIFKVSNSTPAYGKLHTGLYLAAFKDALDRARQLDNMKISDSRFNVLYRRKYPHDKMKYNYEDPRDMDSQIRAECLIAQQHATLCERLKCCHKAEVKAMIPIFGVAKVQRFKRFDTGEPVDSEPDISNNLQLMLLKPLGSHVYNCEVTLGGQLIAGWFVVKLAQRQEHHEILLKEYKTYLKLEEEGFKGIVEVYGLFWCDAPCPGMGRMALLMSYGGKTLLHRKELKALGQPLSICQQFEDILLALKRNGIDHRGLLLEHFVWIQDGLKTNLSLISWGSAKWLMREEWETDNEGAQIIRDFLEPELCSRQPSAPALYDKHINPNLVEAYQIFAVIINWFPAEFGRQFNHLRLLPSTLTADNRCSASRETTSARPWLSTPIEHDSSIARRWISMGTLCVSIAYVFCRSYQNSSVRR